MKYMLILMLAGTDVPPQQIGPFDNVFACEQAVTQIRQAYVRSRAACINLNAKPHHWNGKELPK